MREYIDKSALIERVDLNYNNHQNVSACAVKDMINTTSTITEVEIRNKVIDEFLNEIDKAIIKRKENTLRKGSTILDHVNDFDELKRETLHEIAEQMKEVK